MLNALYDYAVRHELSLPDGYAKKTVAAYISFSSAVEDYVEIHMGDDREIPCPDIGSLANGKEKSNIIVEKRSVVIPDEENAKSTFFRNALVELGQVEPDAALCAEKLSNADVLEKIRAHLDENKIKPANRISFMVDGRKLHNSPHLLEWWKIWRQGIMPPKKGDLAPCLITGELTTPVATAPSIKGLRVVGGHASGDALICFDKPAFCSYGLKQAANAPVSETAMGAVKAALDELISDAPILCGMKFVHWYDRDVEMENDPFFDVNFLGLGNADQEGEEADDDDTAQKEIAARSRADQVIESVKTGTTAGSLDAIYHILLLSGVGGRVMVRRYEMGEYESLQKNLDKWNRDLALVHPYAQGLCKPLKLTGRLIRLLKYQKNDRKIFDRMSKELSGITPAVLTAILGGGRLPDAVAIRALAYIRSKLLINDEEQTDDNLDGWACQWLKVWLLRNHERSEEHLNEYYNPNHPEPAYHCGAAMAIYGEIQHKAMPEVNVNMAQRFYASCIQTPALVLGRLSQMCVHHLAKIDNKFYQNLYRELLERVHTAIGPVIPTTLNLEKQSYFALGYYQMYAKMRKDRMDAVHKNKEEA